MVAKENNWADNDYLELRLSEDLDKPAPLRFCTNTKRVINATVEKPAYNKLTSEAEDDYNYHTGDEQGRVHTTQLFFFKIDD